MIKLSYATFIIVLSILTGSQLVAAVIFTPPAAGGNISYFPLDFAFDSQPTSTAELAAGGRTVPAASGAGLGNDVPNFVDRGGYIDFGVDFATVQITELWTAYRTSSIINTPVPYADLYWSDSSASGRGGPGTYADIADSSFNFGTTTVVANETDFVPWKQDFSSGAGVVVPAFRYLIVETGSDGFADGRATEFAIVVIPESGSIILVGISLLVLVTMGRRRAIRS